MSNATQQLKSLEQRISELKNTVTSLVTDVRILKDELIETKGG